MSRRALLLSALLLLLVSGAASCYTVRLQQGTPNVYFPSGYTGARDTYIHTCTYWSLDNPELPPVHQYEDLNYGASPDLFAGIYETMEVYDVAWSLIRFSTACLASLDFQSARLYVYSSAAQLTAGSVIQSDYDWVAGTANGAVQPGSSCYLYKRYSTLPWTQSPLPNWWSAEYFFQSDPANAGWMYIDLPVSLVRAWQTGSTNSGLFVYGVGSDGNSFIGMPSSDSPDRSHRPYLEVTVVPEPAGLVAVLFGAGGLGCAIRRRR